MLTETPRSFLRTPFIERQEREKSDLKRVYTLLSPNFERIMSAAKMGETLGITHQVADAYARRLEAAGILARRISYERKGNKNAGRKAYWTLLCSESEAVKKLEKIHEEEREISNRPPKPRNNGRSMDNDSLKARIFDAIAEKGEFGTAADLVYHIARPGENIDFHSVTHLLGSLKNQGKVTYRRSKRPTSSENGKRKTSDNVPVNIRLMKNATPKPSSFVEAQIDDPEPTIETPEIPATIPVANANDLPLITALVNRRSALEMAAKMAEVGGQDDLALELLERAGKETPWEKEVLTLWHRYQNCISGD